MSYDIHSTQRRTAASSASQQTHLPPLLGQTATSRLRWSPSQ